MIGRDWVYPQTAPKPAQSSPKDHCEMGGMAGMSGMNRMGGMSAKPADKGMACHSGGHGADGAAKEHMGCCN